MQVCTSTLASFPVPHPAGTFPHVIMSMMQLTKGIFSERGRYVLCVIRPSTRSTLGEYDSRPPLARYVWYVTWFYAHVQLGLFYRLSTLDVTHVRKCTSPPPPPLPTASDEKLGMGLGTRLYIHTAVWRKLPTESLPPGFSLPATIGGGSPLSCSQFTSEYRTMSMLVWRCGSTHYMKNVLHHNDIIRIALQ